MKNMMFGGMKDGMCSFYTFSDALCPFFFFSVSSSPFLRRIYSFSCVCGCPILEEACNNKPLGEM